MNTLEARLTISADKNDSASLSVESIPASRWMLIDDNEDTLIFMRDALVRLTDAEVQCFQDSYEALAALEEAPDVYSLVITDLDMPVMNGMEFCIRAHEVAPHLRIMLATGNGSLTEEIATRAGFCALLRKPFPPTVLKAALARVGLGRSHAKIAQP